MRREGVAHRARLAAQRLRAEPALAAVGSITGVSGLGLEIAGLGYHTRVGDRLVIRTEQGDQPAEIVGFKGGAAQVMPLGSVHGVGPRARAFAHINSRLASSTLAPSDAWLGRVLDPLGRPADQQPAPRPGARAYSVQAQPPPAVGRARLGGFLDLGVRALTCFAPCRAGQRLGLMAGSGIGKSSLLGMLTRGARCDVTVVGLIGERGREVREFIEDDLGPAGMARTTMIVATSDAPPLLRREAAYAAMTAAEYFRDQGASVLLLMDSLTRFCLALREIGLSAGEPPATRGYPPSVFAELPRLLERAGPAAEGCAGSITGLFTVLVEGDDHNEPIADAVRGILDGHVILDRRIAEGGRYPAIDVLRSLSRAATGCHAPEREAMALRARKVLALYQDMADMVRLGAYKPGSDPAVDEAIMIAPRIEEVLRQRRNELSDADASFVALQSALAGGAS